MELFRVLLELVTLPAFILGLIALIGLLVITCLWDIRIKKAAV